jgi:hypothetical protein
MIAAALNERGLRPTRHQRAQAHLLRSDWGQTPTRRPRQRRHHGNVDQHGVAMVLLPSKEWATVKCFEGQIREQTLH